MKGWMSSGGRWLCRAGLLGAAVGGACGIYLIVAHPDDSGWFIAGLLMCLVNAYNGGRLLAFLREDRHG